MKFYVGDVVQLVSFDGFLKDGLTGIRLGRTGEVLEDPDQDGDYLIDFGEDSFYASPQQLKLLSRAGERAIADTDPAPALSAQAIGELIANYSQLGPTAQKLLVELSVRLVKGKAHGDFEDADTRDWDQEALEEDLDACVYRALGSLQRAGKL